MARRSYRSQGSSQVNTGRLVAVLMVMILGAGTFVAAGYAFTGRISFGVMLIILGAFWLSAVVLLNRAVNRRIDGVEPQTSLITAGLTLLLFPDPLAIIFPIATVGCLFFWSQHGFQL